MTVSGSERVTVSHSSLHALTRDLSMMLTMSRRIRAAAVAPLFFLVLMIHLHQTKAQDDPCGLEVGGGGTFSKCKLCPAGAIVGSRSASATTPTSTIRLGVESSYTISTDLSYVPQHHFNITTTAGAAEVINNMDATSRVVGGANALRATYSWMTALYVESENTPGNYFFTCGAALIGPDRVATAAHCVDGWARRQKLPRGSRTIHSGFAPR